MNKIENKIDYGEIKKSLIWCACRVDGCNGGIEGILGMIPWGDDISKYRQWDKVVERFDVVIGVIPSVDMKKFVMMDDEYNDLNYWAELTASKICELYREIIDEINLEIEEIDAKNEELENATGINHKFTIVENVSVKRVYEICAKTTDEALDKMYSGNLNPTSEDEDGDSIFIYDENGKNVSCEDD